MQKRFLALTAGCLLVGCQSVNSDDIKTSGIYANIDATAPGDGSTDLLVSLRVGGSKSNTFLELSANDKLIATQGENSQEMTETSTGVGSVHYITSFPIEAEGTEFTVAFEREVEDSAPNSTVVLPAPFELTGAEDSYSRAEDSLHIEWSPSGGSDQMSWTLDGDCIVIKAEVMSGDPGVLDLSPGSIEAVDGHEGESCSATLTVKRTRSGQLDPAYGEGGAVYGHQVRTEEFLVAP